MSHVRIIPRDFFNEAKLLKCLGHFEICRTEGKCNGIRIDAKFDGEEFLIEQDPSDGTLWVANYRVYIGVNRLHLFTPYNSKSVYPLMARFKGEDYYVFDDNGKWLPTFGIEPKGKDEEQ